MRSKMLITVAVAIALLASRMASAQVETFLLVPTVPGESTDGRHGEWIDLMSFGQSLEPLKSNVVCAGSAVKYLDAASPGLWAAVASNQVFPQMTIEIVKSGGNGERILQEILQNVRVSRVVFSNDQASGRQIETVTLTPQSVTLRYTKYDEATGKPAGDVTSTITCQ